MSHMGVVAHGYPSAYTSDHVGDPIASVHALSAYGAGTAFIVPYHFGFGIRIRPFLYVVDVHHVLGTVTSACTFEQYRLEFH